MIQETNKKDYPGKRVKSVIFVNDITYEPSLEQLRRYCPEGTEIVTLNILGNPMDNTWYPHSHQEIIKRLEAQVQCYFEEEVQKVKQ